MMFTRTKRRNQPGRIGSFLSYLRKGRDKRLRNQRLRSLSSTVSSVELLEDRTLLSATNALMNPNVYSSIDEVAPAQPEQVNTNQSQQLLSHQTLAQLKAESQFNSSEQEHLNHFQDLGQVNIPEGFNRFSATENENLNQTGVNDLLGTAQLITGFGTGLGDDPELNISGYLSNAPPDNFASQAFEDDSSIPLARNTFISSGTQRLFTGTIGDSLNGRAGTGTGDFDFFLISGVLQDERISVFVEDATQFNGLDPSITIYSSTGLILSSSTAFFNTSTQLNFVAPIDGDYYVMVGGRGTGSRQTLWMRTVVRAWARMPLLKEHTTSPLD